MSSSLQDAPEHIKLAVDLIMVLEQNDIDPAVALKALDLIKADLEQKLKSPEVE